MKAVKDVMRTFPYSCEKDESLQIVASWMSIASIKFLPVTDEKQTVVGAVNFEEICKAIKENNLSENELKVQDVMNKNIVSIHGYEDEATALKTMRQYRQNYLTVVDNNQRLKGVVSFVTLARRIIQIKNELSGLGVRQTKINGLGLSAY